MVIVGSVIVDAFCCIAAACIDRDLVFSFCDFAAASLLIHAAQNMEELADALLFAIA